MEDMKNVTREKEKLPAHYSGHFCGPGAGNYFRIINAGTL
jgi:hypothetical protein